MTFFPKNEILIFFPVLNEEGNIEKVILNTRKHYPEADILVVNDGSVDKTAEILAGLEEENIFVVNHIFNMGIGVSLETGCQFAVEHGYSYIVRMDGDGQHDARFIAVMLEPIKTNEVDITIGSRFLGDTEFKSTRFRLIGIKIISVVLTLMSRKKVTDPTSGFCAMNKKAFTFFSKNCAEDYPEPEILVYHKAFRIKEVPISITKRLDGMSSITPLKSFYYMVKVLFALFVHLFRKEIK